MAMADHAKQQTARGSAKEEEGKNGDPVPSTSGTEPKRYRMLDEEVDAYDTYEEYLDSLVSEEDHLYLQDEEMARVIAELGYRSSGDTLTRENFYKLKSSLAEKRLLTLRSGSGHGDMLAMEQASQANGEAPGTAQPPMPAAVPLYANVGPSSASAMGLTLQDLLVRELRSRAKDIFSGDLSSIVFMRTKLSLKKNKGQHHHGPKGHHHHQASLNEPRAVQVSGHIDLGHRHRAENFIPYLTGAKRLVPRQGDLTYYNWSSGAVGFRSTASFEVDVRLPQPVIVHRDSGVAVRVASTNDRDVQERNRSPPKSDKSVFSWSGWKDLHAAARISSNSSSFNEDDVDVAISIFDIRRAANKQNA